MENLYVLVTLFFILIPIYFLYRKKRLASPGGYILLLYLINLSSAMFVDHFTEWYSLDASIFLGINLILFLFPLIVHALNNNKKIIAVANANMILPLSKLIIFFGLFSYTYIFSVVSYTNLLELLLSPTVYRTAKIYGSVVFEDNLFKYFGLIGVNMYTLSLALFFVTIILFPQKKIIILGLIISSLAFPVYTIAIDAGRGGVIVWILMAGLLYTAFVPYISDSTKKIIKTGFLFLFIPLVLLFAFITFGRTEASESKDITEYLINYSSHQFGNFNRFYFAIDSHQNDITSIFQIFGYERTSLVDEASMLSDKYGFSLNVFATFLGSLIVYFHPSIVLSMALVFAFFISKLILLSPRGMGTLLFVLSTSEVFVWGLFYFNHQWRISNAILLTMLALFFYFNPRPGCKISYIEPIKHEKID